GGRAMSEPRMPGGITADARTAATGAATTGPVTLINSFRVSPGRDDAFHELWERTSRYFMRQPGFRSLRLHRAVSDDAAYRWVNVATWDSEAAFRASHATEEFRRVVTAAGWEEFPSSPALFEVVTEVG
ncbi:MAG: antibiotic biosynthesis monooxygenase family protein, partial [Marmoricola sp.]